MPRELTVQELVLFQKDTDYINAGIPVFGSRVSIWAEAGNMVVLIYHTKDFGYALTDISDLGQAKINELAKVSEIHGVWYYLPQAMQEIITERAEQVASVAVSAGETVEEIITHVAQTTGQTLHDLIAPLVDALLVPLVLVGAILGIYLIKKG
jgi:hypothetical protein